MSLDSLIIDASRMIAQARLLAVSSGAGISKESGIPTFREAQTGLWSRYDPEQLATPRAFLRDPNLVWSWYRYRYDLVMAASPNAGHAAVAELEDLLPEVVVITQNVDGLHARAGSSDIIELHGSIARYRCFADCQGHPTIVDMSQVEFDDDEAPGCPYCDNLIRPDVVWYTESLPPGALTRATRLATTCDVMVIVGTSGLIQPAASLPAVAKRNGAALIEVNPAPSMLTPSVDIFLEGPSGVILPRLVSALRSQLQTN